MANAFGYQILKDDTQHAVIKLTGKFDGTGQEANAVRIQANTLSGALATNGFPIANSQGGSANTSLRYHGLKLFRLWYDCASSGDVELSWTVDKGATGNTSIVFLNGNGEYDGAGNWITIDNDTASLATSNGNIGVFTRGMAANDSYTMILELRKDNAHYSRGQFRDPAAFNYGTHNTITP